MHRLVPVKRPLDFIEIARRLPNHEFLICGTGPLKDEVERACHALPNITYCGCVEGQLKDELLTSCDIFISTSVYESLSVSIFEALEKNKIMLVRDIAQLRGIYGEVPLFASSIGDFVEKIVELENDDDLRKLQKITEEKAKKLLKKYSIERAAKRILETYGIEPGANIVAVDDDSPYQTLGGHKLFNQLINCMNNYANVTMIVSKGKYSHIIDPNVNMKTVSRSRYTTRNFVDFILLMIAYIYSMVKAVRKQQADFIFTNSRYSSFVAYFARKFLKMKTLTMMHEDSFFRSPLLSTELLKRFLADIVNLKPVIHLFEEYVYSKLPLIAVSEICFNSLIKLGFKPKQLW